MPVIVQSARIERQVDAGADADLEHALARLDVHPLDGLEPAGMERRTEEQVVDLGELVVDRFDEIVLDGGSRQGPGRGVRAGHQFIFPLGFSLE